MRLGSREIQELVVERLSSRQSAKIDAWKPLVGKDDAGCKGEARLRETLTTKIQDSITINNCLIMYK